MTKTTTFEELIAMVEGEWGEGKGVKFQDCDKDWLKMKNNDDVVEVWNQTKSGVVTLKVFSQQNQVNFVVLFYFILFCFVLFCFCSLILFLLCYSLFFFFFSHHLHCCPQPTLLPQLQLLPLHRLQHPRVKMHK